MKIPPDAKKVYSGTIFAIYQWDQELFDGSKMMYEMVWRRPTVDIIAVVDGKILTIEQEQPGRSLYPGLPGGKIDDNEDPLHAAEREFLEETGYTAESFTLINEYNNSSKIDFHNHLFLAHNPRQNGKKHLDAGEKIKTKLLTFDAFLALARDQTATFPLGLRFEMWEALLDKNKKAEFRKKLGL